MTEAIQRKLNDSAAARWTALVLIALAMFFAYMFVDVMSPLQSLIESERGWDSGVFGTYAASEYILNVCGFLILAGIILDKCGIRFTGILSTSLMVIGASIKYIGVSDWFQATAMCSWLDSWWTTLPGSAKMASFGFMVFGCGCEMAGITVSKAIAKWFKGKEMALAMGLEMAIARLGVFAVFSVSPKIATQFDNSVVAPIAFCTVLLIIGLINFIVFSVMDAKLDKQLGEANSDEPTEEFKVSDLGRIFSSKMLFQDGFIIHFKNIQGLPVLYYSAIFPFQRYATNYLEVTLHIEKEAAADLFRWFPILAMILTPVLGSFLDHKGKGATMLMLGSLIMIACHLSFAFLLPIYPNEWFALLIIVILGVSFSLVPAALWPSVPKIIDPVILGSAYSLIFWIQNIGLCFVPLIIGMTLKATGGYLVPMLIFASLGVLALILSFALKAFDKKKGFGLEEPNIKE